MHHRQARYTAFSELFKATEPFLIRSILKENVPGNMLLEILTQFNFLIDEEGN